MLHAAHLCHTRMVSIKRRPMVCLASNAHRSSCLASNNYNRTIAMLESVMEASTTTNIQQPAEGWVPRLPCAGALGMPPLGCTFFRWHVLP